MRFLELDRLCDDMDELAVLTWRKVALGDSWGLKFREDSITDHNLFALAAAHPGLVVDKHTPPREHATGADWDWWVGSDATGWVVLRIQAMRAHGYSYEHLDHPGEQTGERQYDTLIRHCLGRPGHYPFHVLYNGFADAAGRPEWPADADWPHCSPPRWPPLPCPHVAPELFGCTVASTFEVRKLASTAGPKAKYVPAHLSQSLPWSWRFRRATNQVFRDFSANEGSSSTDGLSRVLSPVDPQAWLDDFQRLVAAQPSLAESSPDEQAWSASQEALPRESTLPASVQHLLSLRRLSSTPAPADADRRPNARTTVVLDLAAEVDR